MKSGKLVILLLGMMAAISRSASAQVTPNYHWSVDECIARRSKEMNHMENILYWCKQEISRPVLKAANPKEASEMDKKIEEFEKTSAENERRQLEDTEKAREAARKKAAEEQRLRDKNAKNYLDDIKSQANKRGYFYMSLEDYTLDIRDLYKSGEKVALFGRYFRTGDGTIEFLAAPYIEASDVFAAAASVSQRVVVDSENAERALRRILIRTPIVEDRSQILVGKPTNVVLLGRVGKCIFHDAGGTTQEKPCLKIDDGWYVSGAMD